MKVIICLLVGYLFGVLNPAALFARIKKKNLRESGTGNLGATNTLLNLGKGYAALVLVFDMAKSYIAYKLAQLIFPSFALAGLMAGCGAIAGHVFPFYMHFKGGKGLASLGGVVLAHDPPLFLFMLIICMTLMLVLNYSFALPISAALLFPVLSGIRARSVVVGLVAALGSGLIIFKHRDDIAAAFKGEAKHTEVREFIKKNLRH